LGGPDNTVFYSDNSGASWTTLDVSSAYAAGGITRNFSEIAVFNVTRKMQTVILAGQRGGGTNDPTNNNYPGYALLRSEDTGATWSALGPMNNYWDGFEFPGNSTSRRHDGIVSPTAIVGVPAADPYNWLPTTRTMSGPVGTAPGNWPEGTRYLGTSVVTYSAVDGSNVWVRTGNSISRTSDGGSNWSVQLGGLSDNGMVDMASSNFGIATDGAQTYYTTDGTNWNSGGPLPGGVAYTDISVVDSQVAYISGWTWNSALVWKTTDGGLNWLLQPISGTPADWIELVSIHALDASTAWAVGRLHPASGRMSGNYLLETIDGSTWHTIPLPYDISNQDADRYLSVFLAPMPIPEPTSALLLALAGLGLLRRRR